MDLVGLLVNSPDKVGQDIGGIGGIEPLGVAATGDVDEIVVFDDGRVVEHGDRDALAQDPTSRFHRLLTHALDDLDALDEPELSR